MSSVMSQKGVTAVHRCSGENQKGAIATQILQTPPFCHGGA